MHIKTTEDPVYADNVLNSIFLSTIFPVMTMTMNNMCLQSELSGSDMSVPVRAPLAAHHLYVLHVGLFRKLLLMSKNTLPAEDQGQIYSFAAPRVG